MTATTSLSNDYIVQQPQQEYRLQKRINQLEEKVRLMEAQRANVNDALANIKRQVTAVETTLREPV